MSLHWIVMITKIFEVLGYAGVCWPSLAFLAFLAFMALDDFLKQKMAFADEKLSTIDMFQQSDVKTNFQTSFSNLNPCDMVYLCTCIVININTLIIFIFNNKSSLLKYQGETSVLLVLFYMSPLQVGNGVNVGISKVI